MAKKKPQSPNGSFPIVGIGASAGGLEALRQVLEKLPADTGMGFVLIQHLDPTHDSQLPDLLARATRLPVIEVRDRLPVKPNHIYVIPPNTTMVLSRGILKLTPRVPGRVVSLPIDTFLKSLAAECGKRAIGVVLSGTATDEAEGVRAIRAEGGITFAQDEKSAKYTGMPHAAVATGCVDFVATPAAIAKELARISRHPYINHVHLTKAATAAEDAGDDLHQIFRSLRSASGVDFTYYKPTTIRRRIERRMAVHQLHTLGQYARQLREHPDEAKTLYEDLLINVTGFFRDPAVFNALKKKVLPKILDQRRGEAAIRLWVPGCSTGEEVYSLAIILLEYLGAKAGNVPIQIFATDISERALAKARLGIYSDSITAHVSPSRLRGHFVRVPGGYQISKAVRELCVFARQNITKDPPFSNLDLISCRNVLIYLGPALQKRVMPVFHYALRPEGFLLLGSSETTTGFEPLFAPVDRQHRVYVKRATATRSTFDFALVEYPDREATSPPEPASLGARAFDVQREADRVLSGRFAPASVLVNEDLEILQFRGHTGLYLEPAAGSASLNLLKMAREGLFMELRTAIHQARRQGVAIRREGLRIKANGGFHVANVEVVPLKSAGSRERHYLVLFEDGSHRPPPVAVKAPAPKVEEFEKTRVRLEQELAATKEYMQSVVEELENANEELKAANEEIQSSNEELQSTNEEMETAKEELQSTNEELTTVNEELQSRNTELGQLNNDLTNVLTSVNLPILLLGPDLRVRRMTPAAEKVLHLRSTDIGRAVTDLRLPIDVPDLEQLIAEAIDTLNVKTREVADRAGHWYSLRVRPYRTADNKIDGAVVKLLDIDTLKRSLEHAEEARDFSDAIVETVREPLLVLDAGLRVQVANAAFYRMFRTGDAETKGQLVYSLGNRQWDIPQLRKLLEEVLPRDIRLEGFEVEHEFPKIGRRVMLLNARRLHQKSTETQRILLAIEDVTQERHLEKVVLDISEDEQQRIGRDLHDGLGQHLTGIGFLCDGLREKLTGKRLPEAKLAAEIVKLLKRATTQTHNLSRGLFPVELKTHGLVTALENLAMTTGLFKIACQYVGDPAIRVRDVSVARHFYRIAQEAVHNAVKHSGGTRIEIDLRRRKGRLTLRVTDNGRGLSPARTPGLGVNIMQYRARIIGATLDLRPGLKAGTVVTCSCPESH